ncbi:MAG: ABC transporter substrate-binding protein [Methanocorpusculum sp.]|uniref:ABC transporter substrate-binding protein n=1 Tax=Methanocorpusculum sp. TaxID=2058474 RepID=UPI0027262A71|nr:ABC transporter substrate-binding protein [Methanocorpusculum sp.]MDO9523034.1 ABC transporter substrate-binding protein [Methanocorpusculum sp.]
MKTKLLVLGVLLALICIVCTAGCVDTQTSDEIVITQTDGTPFTLPHEAQRIILLNSNAGEMLYLLGVSDKVVGVSQSILDNKELGSMFPNAVSVGKWNVPDVETLASLSPDVVIAFASSKPQNADMIEAAGIPIVYIDCYKPTTMISDVTALGTLTGSSKKAREFVTFYQDQMDMITERVPDDVVPQRVFCEGYSDYAAQGKGSGLDLLLDICGAENIVNSDVTVSTTTVSAEWIVTQNPDVIIKATTSNNMQDAENRYVNLVSRTGYSSMTAVQNEKVWLLDAGLAYGPRTFAGAVAVAKMLYPDTFADVNISDIVEEYNEKFGLNVSRGALVYPEL